MSSVLITGATGFVGTALCSHLLGEKNIKVSGTLLTTEDVSSLNEGVEPVISGVLGENTYYKDCLKGKDILIHLAARVHVTNEASQDPLSEFRKTNALGTANLAKQAALAGVKRFVFLSTIGVNGNKSETTPITEGDVPAPHNSYSVSKHEAELSLHKISSDTGMEIVIVRAPIVYGPFNPGNFYHLLRVVSSRLPLPLGCIDNTRSMIYIGNLVDALWLCATHPAAAGQTYLVSDGEGVSTPELVKLLSTYLGVSARLFPFPLTLLRFVACLIKKSDAVDRLASSLLVDCSKIRRELGWQPPFTMEEGLRATSHWFKKQC